MEMNWQQKALAIQALTGVFGFYVTMRGEGDWYVHHSGVGRREGAGISGGFQNGKNPEEAVNQCWEWMTDPKYYMEVRRSGSPAKLVKWNGFMWQEFEEVL